MRYVVIVLWLFFVALTPARAQVSVDIGINVPLYPQLVRIPDYPVYYAPRLGSNFFFYDGLYWVYQRDNWYASSWYNGPWGFVPPDAVPLFVLRVPVRYYRDPPAYFRGWRPEASPRWDDHWGNDWAQQRRGWDRWNRRSAPAPAPLPVYQRKYAGDRYPQSERQRDIQHQNYRYRPRDALVRQHDQAATAQRTPAPTRQGRPEGPQESNRRPQDRQQAVPPPPVQPSAPVAPRSRSPQGGGDDVHRAAPPAAPARRDPSAREQTQPPRPGAAQPEQRQPASRQDKNRHDGRSAPERGQGQENERESGEGRGNGRNR